MRIPFLNTVITWSLKKRIHQMDLFLKYPIEVQNELLLKLLDKAKETEVGLRYNFKSIKNYQDFNTKVPIRSYESIQQEIDRARNGENNIFWSTNIKWFAKSSGTTNAKSKFIPVSEESLENCHYKAVRDMLSIYVCNNKETKMFSGKSLRLGGSSKSYEDNGTYFGDLSAIIIENLPLWAEFSSVPKQEIALMSNWETKMDKILDETLDKDITSLAGVPSWMLVLLNRALERTKKNTILEIWPNLEVYFHGGVNFEPYREQYQKIIPKANFKYYEIYNASEGFFAIQDKNNSSELLLMLDYGVFYEFISMNDYADENSKTIPLNEVKLDTNYALVITTNAGLWRYLIGDTIKFTSLKPYRIKITGRTKHFINAFGEELIIENTDKAIQVACEKTNAEIKEYTVAPVFMDKGKKGAHEWLIEFKKEPTNLSAFTKILDDTLKTLNSDYEAKRNLNITLNIPIIKVAKKDTFYTWLKQKGKLGGQHKIPRLMNNRVVLEELLEV